MIDLEHVDVRFIVKGGKTLQASRDVSLSIGAGEIVTVVGESGCGKSTVGKLVLGVLKPTQGRVLYDGTDVWGRGFKWSRELRLMVAVVHQDSYASLNPVRTVGQTLRAPLLYHKLAPRSEVDRKVLALLEDVGLTPADYFANKYPFQLSGGQRQRVSIARATMLSPRLILTDEPVSGVDASLRLAILDLMRGLNRSRGIAFLYITHDLATARYFGKGGRLVVMYLGSIVEQGEVGEVIDHPRHPYLQALLAALPPLDPREARAKVELPLKSLDMPVAP
ncbi:MAG: ABC transporter ATP-binding protein, partial [Candidatus Xenobia bacterium]